MGGGRVTGKHRGIGYYRLWQFALLLVWLAIVGAVAVGAIIIVKDDTGSGLLVGFGCGVGAYSLFVWSLEKVEDLNRQLDRDDIRIHARKKKDE